LERHVGFDGFTFKIIQKISNIFRKDAKNVTSGPPGWLGTLVLVSGPGTAIRRQKVRIGWLIRHFPAIF
jgi:hypothetical protein